MKEFNGPKGYKYQKQKFEQREIEASQSEGKKALNKYDSDQDNKVDKYELKQKYADLGMEKIEKLITERDSDQDGKLSEEELEDDLAVFDKLTQENEKAAKYGSDDASAFNKVNSDGDEYLDKYELMARFQGIDPEGI
jgi:Ca2+-binding EF-hand superfamily protein